MLFHDEVLIRHWIAQNRDYIKFIKRHSLIEDLFCDGDISPAKFFHYVGRDKDKQHALMWPIYQAYKSNRALYEGWRDSRSLIIDEYTGK